MLRRGPFLPMWSNQIGSGFPWEHFWLKPAVLSCASLRKERLSRVFVGGPGKGWEENRHCMTCTALILSCRIPWQQRYCLGFLEGMHNPAKLCLFPSGRKQRWSSKCRDRFVPELLANNQIAGHAHVWCIPRKGGHPRSTNSTKAV